jgi:hypothetical protein
MNKTGDHIGRVIMGNNILYTKQKKKKKKGDRGEGLNY